MKQSKQDIANDIHFSYRDEKRSVVVNMMSQHIDCSDAYLGTLFRAAKKNTALRMSTEKSVTVNDGRKVFVGDWVEFKSDIEQGGRVTKINGRVLTLENEDGFSGDYLRYATITTEDANSCW